MSSSMYPFQTVHHQMVYHLQCTRFRQSTTRWCNLQCTYFRQFTTRWCVMFNLPVSAARLFSTRWCVIFSIPVSSGSPPDGVIFNVPFSVARRFSTRWCAIFNVPASAPKTVRHKMSVSSAVYLSQTVHYQIMCHLQCTFLRQFTTR